MAETSAHSVHSWRVRPEDSRLVRMLRYAALGYLGGWALLFGVGVVLAASTVETTVFLAAGIGLFFVLAFRFAMVGVLFEEHSEEWAYVEWYWLALSSVGGAGLLYVGFTHGTVVYFGTFFGVFVLPLVLSSWLQSTGELDTDSGTLTYHEQTVDLHDLTTVRRYRLPLGNFVVYRASYVRGSTDITTPRLFVLPSTMAADADAAFDAGIAAESGEYEPPDPIEGYLIAGLGVVFLAVTAVVVVAVLGGGSDANPAGLLYVVVFLGGLGAALVLFGILHNHA
ncbi:hypothetical protein [Haloarchaeobius sp. DFWS5]|uniref:hypothetical protein n=1 Tax=Haloarchaeobius sp. DFWS5 TaxID=3446114 RepID=UPI003EC1098D